MTAFRSALPIANERDPSPDELSRMDIVRHEILTPIRELDQTQRFVKAYLRLLDLKRRLQEGRTDDSGGASSIGTGPLVTPPQPPRVVTTVRGASIRFDKHGFVSRHPELAKPFVQQSRSFKFLQAGIKPKRKAADPRSGLLADIELIYTQATESIHTGHGVDAAINQLNRVLDGRTESDVHWSDLDATRLSAQLKYEQIEQELWFMERLGGYSAIVGVCTGEWKTSIKPGLKEFVQHKHPDLYQQFLVPVAGSTSITSPRGGIVSAPAWVPAVPRG